MKKRLILSVLMISLFSISSILKTPIFAATKLKIAIMQAKKGEKRKYKPLQVYLAQKGINVTFAGTRNYPHAAKLFAAGKVDAIFSGSGVAGIFIIKGLAYPVVRPVAKSGWSFYWADIIAPKGSPRFTGKASYFKGKKVLFCAIASSGEIYYRSLKGIKGVNAQVKKASSHGAAIRALASGLADVAIVKNRVWDSVKRKYPKLKRIGRDRGKNPNGTLMVSRKKVNRSLAKKITNALLALKRDKSSKAMAVKKAMGIKGFVKTTKRDFRHTLKLLKRAGVTRSFDFSF